MDVSGIMTSILPAGTNDTVGKIILSCVVVLVALFISRSLQWPINHILTTAQKRNVGGSIFQNIVRILVWGWAICAILDICFDLDMAGILGALGIVGVAVSLGAQQTIANVIGGIIVSLSGMIGPDDWITIDGHKEARVVDTSWRRTTLEDEDGVLFAVPNSVMVSTVVEKGNPYAMIVVPFSLKPTVSNVEGLLAECEEVLLERQIATKTDWEQMRPKAHVAGASLGVIQAEVKLYATRELDTRAIERAVLPALIDFLQQRDVLAQLELADTVHL